MSSSSSSSPSDSSPLPVRYVSPDSPVVELLYDDLIHHRDLSLSIENAYGPNGLGLLVVSGIPNYSLYRRSLLPLAQSFAQLPDSIKSKYEHSVSHYSFGWSHGKEQLAGKPDYAKGSYYNNPIHDRPFHDRPDLIEKYPSFCCDNIWPSDDLPSMEKAFKQLGQLMVDTGKLLALHCDRYVKKHCPSYESNLLHNIISNSRTHKARLLHYFPVDSPSAAPLLEEQKKAKTEKKGTQEISDDEFGSWCGWHNDHGSLTALCSALFLKSDGSEVKNPDPLAGLYAKSRSGKVIKIAIPADSLAFQLGEAEQIHSGGLLQATPHCVYTGSGDINEKTAGVSRNTFALFMEPQWDMPMSIPEGRTAEDATVGSSHKFLPCGVPELSIRWNNKQNFGEFTTSTLSAYYPENKM